MGNAKEALRALCELGAADLAHINGDLATHLLGTYERLCRWGSPEPLCMAGLFHSVYGTYGFEEQLIGLQHRDEIIKIIGADAECLVYVYAACDRAFFYPRLRREDNPSFKDRFCGAVFIPDAASLRSFCELTIANELDVALTNHTMYIEKYGRFVLPLFGSSRFQSHINQLAREECIKCFFPGQI